ncbi:MAG: glycosyltransferase [Bdellovibrionaceae bacterium]|nr:glycosyltransferase [Pseudobdellovibrionaceae bacterium]
MKSISWVTRFIIIIVFSLTWGIGAFATKTVIFYSSIGMGHLSASRAIKEKIESADPQAQVELKDIRDFMPTFYRKLDAKLYLFIFKYMPGVFESVYKSAMKKGNEVKDLSQLNTSYDSVSLAKYLNEARPDSIIATHYGSAIAVSNLKENGQIPDAKLAWVHTDYIEQYFPRISQRMDMTFLGHKDLVERWQARGVRPEKLQATGIPVRQLPEVGEVDKNQVLKEVGMSGDLLTFVMSGGSEGLRDYPAVVRSLSQAIKEPIQVIAICGKNTKAFAELEQLAKNLPPNIQLKPLGFIPNKQLIELVTVADLYITKAGGLSPTEGALMAKPLLLVNEYGGHEAENAEFFRRAGLAEIVDNSKDVGPEAVKLLANTEKVQVMQEAQREYRNSLNLDQIAKFVKDPKVSRIEKFDIGLLGKSEVGGTLAALSKLDKDFPADVEILLSYAKSKTGTYFGDGLESNPFGHIAIRVGNDVYTVNHLAVRGEDPQLIHKSSLEEYLYTTKSYYKNEEFTGMQGQAYAKDTLALRLDGFSPESIQKIIDEFAKIEELWKSGKLDYKAKTCNCADITLRVLGASGFELSQKVLDRKIKLPLDVFDAVLKTAESISKYTTSLIHYSYVKNSKNEFRASGFPLSFYQLKRAFKNIRKKGVDPIEAKVNVRIQAPASEVNVQYELIHSKKIMAPNRCELIFYN